MLWYEDVRVAWVCDKLTVDLRSRFQKSRLEILVRGVGDPDELFDFHLGGLESSR